MTNPGSVAVTLFQILVQKEKSTMGMYNRLTSNQLEFKSCLDKSLYFTNSINPIRSEISKGAGGNPNFLVALHTLPTHRYLKLPLVLSEFIFVFFGFGQL